jgi:hypothetical protein
VLPALAITVAFLSVGYVFSEPLRGQGTNSVVKICGRVLERTEGWLRRPSGDETPMAGVQVAENDGQRFARPGRAVSRITITPARYPLQNQGGAATAEPMQTDRAEAQPPSPQPAATANAVRIPESLEMQVQNSIMPSVA